MQIKLTKTAGFCWGVKRAIDIALKLARQDNQKPVYTYGPLAHNPQVIKFLEEKGIKAIKNIEGISSGTLIIRSHGISPQEQKKLEKSGLKIVDATCPRVKAVQLTIGKHIDEGYHIIIMGDKKHPEVIALLGFAGEKGDVVISAREVNELHVSGKICLVAQTTQSEAEFEAISKIAKKKFPDIKIINTICDSARIRQEEIKNLAQSVDAIIIVGGKDSGNTKVLVKIARSANAPTFHLAGKKEIDPLKMLKYRSIGVAAGASTPDWVIKDIVNKLSSLDSLQTAPAVNGSATKTLRHEEKNGSAQSRQGLK